MIAKNESSPPVWPEASIEQLGALLQREDHDEYGTIESFGTSLNDEEARFALHVRRQICEW